MTRIAAAQDAVDRRAVATVAVGKTHDRGDRRGTATFDVQPELTVQFAGLRHQRHVSDANCVKGQSIDRVLTVHFLQVNGSERHDHLHSTQVLSSVDSSEHLAGFGQPFRRGQSNVDLQVFVRMSENGMVVVGNVLKQPQRFVGDHARDSLELLFARFGAAVEHVVDGDITLGAVQVQHGDVSQLLAENLAGLAGKVRRVDAGRVEDRGVGGVVVQHRDRLAAGVGGEDCHVLRIVGTFQPGKIVARRISVHGMRTVRPAKTSIEADLRLSFPPANFSGAGRSNCLPGKLREPRLQPFQVGAIDRHEIVGLQQRWTAVRVRTGDENVARRNPGRFPHGLA